MVIDVVVEMIDLMAKDLCRHTKCVLCPVSEECLKRERIGTENLKRYYLKEANERISNNE